MDRKNRILMVDDDPNLLTSLTDILKLHGFEAVSTIDGKSAIETARDDGIDVALIDLNLADMPGLDVLSGIKQVSPNTECMLLTGYASQDTAIEALNRGAFAYFQKPFDIDMLILSIRRAIEKRDSQAALALSEARHQMAADLTSDYVYEMSVDENNQLKRSWISESFTRITGYTPEEMDDRGGWAALIYPQERGAMEAQYARLLSNQSDFREYRIVRKDGEVRCIEDFSRPITDPASGRVVKVIGAARDITDKKRSQQALADTENALQAMFNSVSESLLLIETDGTIVAVNETTARRLGTDPEKLVGRNAFSYVDADVADNRKKYADQVIATGQPAHFEDVRFGRRIDSSIYPVFNHQNEVQRLAIFGKDVTEKREAERELKAQAEKLESIYRAAPIGIGINANRVILEANQRFCEITGYQRDEIIGQSTRLLYPDDATFEQVGELRKKSRGPDQLFEVETKFKRKDGEIIDVLIRSSPMYSDGEAKSFVFTVRDITTQKESIRALQESEEMFSKVFNGAPFAIVISDHEDGRIVDVNPAFTVISGYEKDEVVGKLTGEMPVWRNTEDKHLVFDLLDQGHKILDQEYVMIRKDGDTRYGLLSSDFIQLKGKTYNLTTVDDITERKQREIELQVMAEVSEALRTSVTREEMQAVLIDHLINLLHLDGVTLEEVVSGDGSRQIVCAGGMWSDLEGDIIPAGEGIGAQVIESGTARLIDDISKSNEVFNKSAFTGLKSAACIPLLIESVPIGLFWVGSRRSLTEMDMRLMRSVAGMAANAIKRISLYEEAMHLVERLKLQGDAMDAAANAIIILDEYKNIEWINPAFTTLTGYDKQEAIGHKVSELQRSEIDQTAVFEELEEALDQGRIWSGRIVNQRKDGSTYIESLTITPLTDSNGRILKYVEIKEDVTDQELHDREKSILINVSNAMRRAVTRDEIIAALLDQLLSEFKIEGASIEILNQKTGELFIELARGNWKPITGLTIPPGEGVSAEVLRTGQPLLINNAQNNEQLVFSEYLAGCKSMACAPLMVEDATIGLLWIGSQRELVDRDVQVLKSISDMGATAIHRADLNEQTLRRLDEINTLRTIDQAINNSLDINLTLELIVKQLRQLCGGDAADILVYRPALLTLTYAAGDGFRTDEIKKSSLRIGSGGAGRVALEQKPLWSEDMRKSQSECVRKELVSGEEFIAYHACPLVVKGEIKGVLEVFHRQPFAAADEWKNILQTVATQAAIAIDNSEMFQGMQKLNTDLLLAYDETIEGWAAALELRDHETEGHSRRVTEHTLRIARAAGMNQEELQHVRRGALLHDIGKISVPDAVLNKPGPLTDEEWVLMKTHPQVAYDLLSKVRYVRPSLEIPYCHHERWDGGGYPRGLKGEEIPLSARLFALVDVYDALTSGRPYREAWSRDKALEYIREQSGKHFDPHAVELFFQTLDN